MSRRIDPMTATPDDGISDHQRNGIAELLGKLDRPYPPGGIGGLSFTEAGDLIIASLVRDLTQHFTALGVLRDVREWHEADQADSDAS